MTEATDSHRGTEKRRPKLFPFSVSPRLCVNTVPSVSSVSSNRALTDCFARLQACRDIPADRSDSTPRAS